MRCWELSDVRVMASAIDHPGFLVVAQIKCQMQLRLWKMAYVRLRNWTS